MSDEKLEFTDKIGQLLGIHLALFEYDWECSPESLELAQMVTMISEAYRNFSQGGLPGFHEDFDRGYKLGKRDVYAARRDAAAERAKGPSP